MARGDWHSTVMRLARAIWAKAERRLRAGATPSAGTPYSTRGFLVAISATVVLTWGLVWWQSAREHELATRGARVDAQNIARTAAVYAEQIFRSIDQFTWGVKQIYEAGHLSVAVAGLLRSSSLLGNLVVEAGITDAEGRYTIINGAGPAPSIDLGKDESFRFHRDRPIEDLHISNTAPHGGNGQWNIRITRRLNWPDGRFAGIVVVLLHSGYFGPFHQSLALTADDSFSILGLDGGFRVRYPYAPAAFGHRLDPDHPMMQALRARATYGTYRRASAIDGVERIFAFQKVENYPLAIAVGRPTARLYFGAASDARRYVLAAAAVTVLLIAWTGSVLMASARAQADRRRIAEALAQANAANGAKSEFLAQMSHELRTPLNAILGYSEAMLLGFAGEMPGRGIEYVRHVHGAGKQLLALVSDILDLSRLEAGRAVLAETEFRLLPVVEEAIDTCRPAVVNRQVSIQLRPQHLDIVLHADRRAVLQILINLLANAIKFTDAGTIEFYGEAVRDRFVVAVRDTGIGIAAVDINRITRAFERAGNVQSGKHEGVGLGLAIVSNLAKLHGGTLDIQSALGVGTETRLCLPRARVVTRPEASTAAA